MSWRSDSSEACCGGFELGDEGGRASGRPEDGIAGIEEGGKAWWSTERSMMSDELDLAILGPTALSVGFA